jgi:hypothetical protein
MQKKTKRKNECLLTHIHAVLYMQNIISIWVDAENKMHDFQAMQFGGFGRLFFGCRTV